MRFVTDDRVVDTGVNKRKIEVICAGLPRCATSSLQAALETPFMGYSPCMHMAHVMPHSDRRKLCLLALKEQDREKRRKLLASLFDGHAATADFPGFMFSDDLMDMYPDAPVILNQRKNGKVWSESITNSLMWFGSKSYLVTCCLWSLHREHYRIHQAAYALCPTKFGVPMDFSERFYDAYNDWLRAEAKKRGRPVLEWKAGDGYAPICDFLGKDAPPKGTEFPHVNEQSTMTFLKRLFILSGVLSWAALGGGLWASWRYGPDLLAKATPLLQGYLSRQ